MSDGRLIVGLGNPGKEYEYTRHNLGFLVVEELAKRLKTKFHTSSFTKAFMATARTDEGEIILLMPLTYVNHSGIAVKALISKKGLALENILVLSDDLNLSFGQLRLRSQGSDGGHNGLKSLTDHLGSGEFARLRMGIDRPTRKDETVAYVLQEFNKSEMANLRGFIEDAVDCCMVWIKEGTIKAMDQYNRRKDDGKKRTHEQVRIGHHPRQQVDG